MPSAVMKPEKKACVEAEEPIKQALNVIEKKIRNLEKRKGKLEEYKAKAKGGAKLNDDQKQAISRYDSVLASIDFAKDLTKQLVEIQEKTEKLMKKKLKLEQKVQHMEEVSRMQEVLRLQNLLENMGADDVREHFKNGSKGAVTLSEDNLTQLDELYKLISPSRDGETSYAEQLAVASEHLACYVEDKDKEVLGTTYKDLRQLVGKISDCGYFDKASSDAQEPESEQAEDTQKDDTEPEVATTESEPASSATVTPAQIQQQSEQHIQQQAPSAQQQPAVMHAAMVNDVLPQQTQQQVQAPITHQPQPASLSFTDQSLSSQVQPPPQSQSMVAAPGDHADQIQFGGVVVPGQEQDESFFSTMDLTKPRAFTDIVSSVQGNFNFLQDSEIATAASAKDQAKAQQDPNAHVDPAVVASRPMHSQQQPDAYTTPSSYTTSALQDQMAQLSTQEPVQDVTSDPSALVAPQATQGSTLFTSQTYDDTPQQTSWATAAEQSWGSSAAEHSSWVEQTSQPQSWADQTASHAPPTAWSTNTSQDLSSSGPAPIPLPSETVPGQPLTFNSADGASFSQVASDSQEKQSSLNPNANVFSMYSEQQGFQSHQQQSDYDQRRGKDSYGHDGYQTQGYRGRRDYGNNQRRDGGDRRSGGGRQGGGGGYQGGRGGRQGGSYGGSDRGGQQQNRGGPQGGGGGPYQNGGRGGGNRGNSAGSTAPASTTTDAGSRTWQGYPPRTDYRPAGGYQGSSPFTGGMRGGPRGGSGGPRGGPRGGGYGGRPNSGQ